MAVFLAEASRNFLQNDRWFWNEAMLLCRPAKIYATQGRKWSVLPVRILKQPVSDRCGHSPVDKSNGALNSIKYLSI